MRTARCGGLPTKATRCCWVGGRMHSCFVDGALLTLIGPGAAHSTTSLPTLTRCRATATMRSLNPASLNTLTLQTAAAVQYHRKPCEYLLGLRPLPSNPIPDMMPGSESYTQVRSLFW